MERSNSRAINSSKERRQPKEEERKQRKYSQQIVRQKTSPNKPISPMDLALSALLDSEITALRRVILAQQKILAIRIKRLNLIHSKMKEFEGNPEANRIREDMKFILELAVKEVESSEERLGLTHNYIKVLIDEADAMKRTQCVDSSHFDLEKTISLERKPCEHDNIIERSFAITTNNLKLIHLSQTRPYPAETYQQLRQVWESAIKQQEAILADFYTLHPDYQSSEMDFLEMLERNGTPELVELYQKELQVAERRLIMQLFLVELSLGQVDAALDFYWDTIETKMSVDSTKSFLNAYGELQKLSLLLDKACDMVVKYQNRMSLSCHMLRQLHYSQPLDF